MTGSRDLAIAAAQAAAAKQATDVVVLDVSELIVITDHFVIVSGSNERQVRTIGESIEEALRSIGRKPIRREGERDAQWMLLDYGDLVAHVFHDEAREYYGLERLWKDAPVIDWEERAASNG